jgi:hypothetical protein
MKENGFLNHEPSLDTPRLYPRVVKPTSHAERYAERVLDGVDDQGAPERIVVWIDRKEDGVWAVGRAVDPQFRTTSEPRSDDFVAETYELDDALERANAVLEDDVTVLETDGELRERVAPFTKAEILPRLERWFFRES